jgi:hypothetical protein
MVVVAVDKYSKFVFYGIGQFHNMRVGGDEVAIVKTYEKSKNGDIPLRDSIQSDDTPRGSDNYLENMRPSHSKYCSYIFVYV